MSMDTPLQDDKPHKPADDTEEIYYSGSPMLRAESTKLAVWWLVGVLLIASPFVYHAMSNNLWLPWIATLIMIALGLLAFFLPVLLQRTIRYRITNYRIDYERGVLSKRIDTLELWHVEDISFYQSLFDRMTGTGTITIISRDETMPKLLIRGVPNPRPLFETLKQRVIAVKRQSGVVKMDVG